MLFKISFQLFPIIKIIDGYTVPSSKVSKLTKLKRYYSNEIEIVSNEISLKLA